MPPRFALPKILALTATAAAAIAVVSPVATASPAPAPSPASVSMPHRAAVPAVTASPDSYAAQYELDAVSTVAKSAVPRFAPVAPHHATTSAPKHRAAAVTCKPEDFAAASGSALVDLVKSSPLVDCLYSLFNVTGQNAHGIFQEAQMTTVADALADAAPSYPGDNSTNVEQLVMFLRAGYFVQSNNPQDVGQYGATLADAIERALDGYFANPHLLDVSDANGEVLGETVILTDSANEQGRYLDAYQTILTSYTSSYDQFWYMVNAVNNVFTPIFRGHWNPAYLSAVTADPSIIDTLHDFAKQHLDLLGTDKSFLAANAGSETARFLDTAALKAKAKPLTVDLLQATSITGPTAALWVRVAGSVWTSDKDNCADYDVCDLPAKVKAAALPITYDCDSGHTFHAQSATQAELAAACASVQGQDAYFHTVVKDHGPVADDHNANIEMNVFASAQDYQTYAGVIFGIDTDNGGMYLEGDPAAPGNQARVIQYQKPANGDNLPGRIWNLNHEYTHYLDGRYDAYGDFTAATAVPDVWWVEGVAEYISYSYLKLTDRGAMDEAKKHTYQLSTLWQTTYANSNETRTYPWGYLAVRYMVERHPADVQAILAKFRTGDYQGGYAVYNETIGNRYDADFTAWLDRLAS